jgi:hypothetical protein
MRTAVSIALSGVATPLARVGVMGTKVSSLFLHSALSQRSVKVREAKDCGLSNLPFQSFAQNQVWLWLSSFVIFGRVGAWLWVECGTGLGA